MGLGKVLGVIGKIWFQRAGVSFAGNLILNGWPIITQHSRNQIKFGNNAVLTSLSRYTAMGLSHSVVIRTLTGDATISVGDNTGLSGTTIRSAASVSIGSDCLIGSDVIIVDTDFHPIDPMNRRGAPLTSAKAKPIVIGDNVFIGARTIVLKGVSIGKNSVIGAGSLVCRDLPANSICAGNPCVKVSDV